MLFPIVIGLLAGILFGLATPFSKILLGSMNSFQLAGLLYLGAALVFLPYVGTHFRRETQLLKTTHKTLKIVGVVLFGGLLGPVLLMMGLKSAQSASVSLWLNLELVATAILGAVFFKDHLDRTAIAGVALTILAGVLMSVHEGPGGILPAVLVMLACICWGIDNQLTAIIDGVSPQTITCIKGLVAGTVNLCIGFGSSNAKLEFVTIAGALVLGMISYGLSIVLYVSSAQQLGATRSQMVFSTGPFWGILAAYLILGDPVSLYSVLAIVLLAGGIGLTILGTHSHPHHHYAVTHIHSHLHDDNHHDHLHPSPIQPGVRHTHIHAHPDTEHTHTHYPDLHHRHPHG
jgi:drug/metabolite transporter (DMT)-like permease